ncbi:unnamed protein product [Bursaphelenchus okinawaensis]|uniref:WD_REPEATS_REGION domain-containing protein n=1 Tax=Bursaphelenchus okinawaensis TaxID=465554 RepID=A0A811LIA5_9BILA|nr:unnamed protein product [Bursaphelenchus okinawaensis]CAG9126334.1 unnamed protein product [Bursaphelenchus okinawaensis]
MDGAVFTSDELNYLIYRYLLENGFQHSAFTFANESSLSNTNVDAAMIPRGALISIVQKGLHFTEAEFFSTLASSSAEKYEAWKYERALGSINLFDAVLPDTERLKKLEEKIIEEVGEEAVANPLNIRIMEPQRPGSAISAPSSQDSSEGDHHLPDDEIERRVEQLNVANDVQNASVSGKTTPHGYQQQNLNLNEASASINSPSRPQNGTVSVAGHSGKKAASAAVHGLRANSITASSNQLVQYANGKLLPNNDQLQIDPDLELDRNKVQALTGHNADVFICSWNPKHDCFASGSGDSTARLWFPGPDIQNPVQSMVLMHEMQQDQNKNKDVTSLNWSSSGEYLATGCYDGVARIWDRKGHMVLDKVTHAGPIFALKWNYAGTRVLSAGVDNATVVWDPTTNTTKSFKFHTQSALDVDWINDETFASCSVDSLIHICHCQGDLPLKTFRGHANEVNAVKYDRISRLLASCSDDRTLKVWNLDEESPVFDVTAHDKEIYTIRWSPTGNVLASASFDCSVKIWDLQSKVCARQLQKHTESVYTVAFHPEGRLLASGSFDRTINVWDLNVGRVVMTYTGCEMNGGFFEVDWNRSGEKLAASAASGTMLMFDLRFIRNMVRN